MSPLVLLVSASAVAERVSEAIGTMKVSIYSEQFCAVIQDGWEVITSPLETDMVLVDAIPVTSLVSLDPPCRTSYHWVHNLEVPPSPKL